MFIRKLAVCSVIILFSAVALACPDKKEGECKDGQCKYKKNDLAALLKLEGERADKVREIQKQYKTDMQAERAKANANITVLNEQNIRNLGTVLTPAELEQVQSIMAEHKSHGGGKGHYEHGKKDGEPRHCDH